MENKLAPTKPPVIKHTLSAVPLLENKHLYVSCYQAGKILILASEGKGSFLGTAIYAECISHVRAMGFCKTQQGVAVAGLESISIFDYKKDKVIGRYAIGNCDVHDIGIGNSGDFYFVATKLNALLRVDARTGHILTHWGEVHLGDTRHLNGLGMREGAPWYLTEFGAGWRSHLKDGTPSGKLWDIQSRSEQPLLKNLNQPHSPTYLPKENTLYFLESGYGTLCRLDLDSGQTETVLTLDGYPRGIEPLTADVLAITTSKDRKTGEGRCAIWFVSVSLRKPIGIIEFFPNEDGEAVTELYDLVAIPTQAKL